MQGKHEIKERLKSKGFKMTSQRFSVIETMEDLRGTHLSCEEIFEKVKKNLPGIGIATIYRTIQMLDEVGYVNKLNVDDGKIRYEISLQEELHHHHHLICKGCNQIIEVKVDLLEELEKTIEANYEFTIFDHDLKFFGKCKKCVQE